MEKSSLIQDEYFTPAVDLLSKSTGEYLRDEARFDIYRKYALFNEQQYQQITRSDEIKRLEIYQKLKEEEISERKLEMKNSSGKIKIKLQGEQRRAELLLEQDKARFQDIMLARQGFLDQAVRMLSNCLRCSDASDTDCAVRLCSLWFANFHTDAGVFSEVLAHIPSGKLVFLAHQLSAHLSSTDTSNVSSQLELQKLLLRMCSEHPFHSLYQIYLLQSSRGRSTNGNDRLSSQGDIRESHASRVKAATDLFEKVLAFAPIQAKARDIKKLCDTYLEWAQHPTRSKEGRDGLKPNMKHKIPNDARIKKIRDVQVPITTIQLPVDPTMKYANCIWIQGYGDTFEIAGGINRPKISYCLGSDGKSYKQLVRS